MSKTAKVLIITALVLGAMLLITWLVPDVRELARTLSVSSKLPMWLVGLAAPILFLFKKLGGLFGGLLGDSATERDIRTRNEEIKAKLDGLERDVRQLDEWRRTEIGQRRLQVADLDQHVAGMRTRAQAMDQDIATLIARRDQLESEMQDVPRPGS